MMRNNATEFLYKLQKGGGGGHQNIKGISINLYTYPTPSASSVLYLKLKAVDQ